MADHIKATINRMRATKAYGRLEKDLIAMTVEGVIYDPELNNELKKLINRLEKRLIENNIMDDDHNLIYPVQV